MKVKKHVGILASKRLVLDSDGNLLMVCHNCVDGSVTTRETVGGVEFTITEDCPVCHGAKFVSVHEAARTEINAAKRKFMINLLFTFVFSTVAIVSLLYLHLRSEAPVVITVSLGLIMALCLWLFCFLETFDFFVDFRKEQKKLSVLDNYVHSQIEKERLTSESDHEPSEEVQDLYQQAELKRLGIGFGE
ncbi:hypothetical protein A2382_01755 [Candidatus Woesebacteria bacterium RIFOXYB1_FULL_38_16]|uniref:Uncharacterized protein n=1 Tax=Candidatus Woesebacteria bacterium RIFOXYB1_FULL_38_16 TaxID=1802538 RepID=A0A1F8CWP6_9BACT|nr:MAG: hypothetical protein A2382_01755 [Candidatus Woesebacteria bacterium RIFOXYB1_FULL_38_16]